MKIIVLMLGLTFVMGATAQTTTAPEPRPKNLVVPFAELERPALTPKKRPNKVILAMSKRPKSRRGALCGVEGLEGVRIDKVSGPAAGCGIKNPVSITGVAGVRLSTPARIDCTTAQALDKWVRLSAAKELKSRGGLKELRVAASYACRTRNNQKGARMSEHSLGHAIDISGFTLGDGTSLTVLKDWKSGRYSRAMRNMHKGACGIFGTVLGPNSDRFHQDHFHFDTARYRSGAYCR